MNINWYGQSCFKLQNNEQTILIDPDSPKKDGLKGPNFKANIILLTDVKEATEKTIKEDAFLINMPGEYEVNGVFVYGVAVKSKENNLIVYQLTVDEIKYGVLGSINSLLSGKELDRLDGVDVLFVPIGGEGVLNIDQAVELLNAIEPQIVIPCCFDSSDQAIKEKFLKEAGIKEKETLSKISIKSKDLLKVKETRVIFPEI
jgi:hypothetical protein